MKQRTAYELSASQVTTPTPVVDLFWELTNRHREHFQSVLDLGAGDCRFSRSGTYGRYVGVEIDNKRSARACLPDNGIILPGCAFKHPHSDYDACIGNPPYVRHHDLGATWKAKTTRRLEKALGIILNKHCNLYLYFVCLGLLKTKIDGLVSMVIPYEWVSRPSAKPVRDYIKERGWDVSIFRFQSPIFTGVLTTASVTIIDKAAMDGKWRYFDITTDHKIIPRNGVTNGDSFLSYGKRGKLWAMRGLSPGSQKIFTLTEDQRVHAGLTKRDVLPCVTTMRHLPRTLKTLTRATFEKYYVRSDKRCWLIRSNAGARSQSLKRYLRSIPKMLRDNYTCGHQKPWYKFRSLPIPQILLSCAFTKFGPKVLLNSIRAHSIGTTYGIHVPSRVAIRPVQSKLLAIDFERQIVSHAGALKKLEVRQVNTVLKTISEQELPNGRRNS